jgi:malic enzyme
MMDRHGLVHAGRFDLAADQIPFAVDEGWLDRVGLSGATEDPVAVARALRASILIGATGCPGAFSEALVRAVAGHTSRPIVLPLSNPSDRAEATPSDVLEWTAGRALVATGSPSADLAVDGRRRTIGQANNVFIFPGVGLGAIVTGAREVPDEAFVVAARALAAATTREQLAAGSLYPPIRDLRRVARAIALAVAGWLVEAGDARCVIPPDGLARAVDDQMWTPEYVPLVMPSAATPSAITRRPGAARPGTRERARVPRYARTGPTRAGSPTGPS